MVCIRWTFLAKTVIGWAAWKKDKRPAAHGVTCLPAIKGETRGCAFLPDATRKMEGGGDVSEAGSPPCPFLLPGACCFTTGGSGCLDGHGTPQTKGSWNLDLQPEARQGGGVMGARRCPGLVGPWLKAHPRPLQDPRPPFSGVALSPPLGLENSLTSLGTPPPCDVCRLKGLRQRAGRC